MIGFVRDGRFLACGFLLALAALPATAQTIDPAQLAPTQAIDSKPGETLFGNWGGMRDGLMRQGVNIQIDAVTEFAGNVSGGTRQGATFANQIGLGAHINWERLADITGLSMHLIAVNRSGSRDSRVFGDNLLPVQEIYGSGGDVAVHLVSLYAQETLFDKRLDIALGRMNVENDFGGSPLYCNFMNNALCGDPKALPGGDIGHSAYPDAVWAARVKLRPVPDFLITAGVYEVNQGLYSDAYYRSGFRFDTSQDSGVYLPVELAWEPKLGADALPGHYRVGFGYDSSAGYKDFSNAIAGAPRSHAGNTQIWLLADQMLLRNGENGGLTALGGYILNDPNNTAYADQFFVGLVDKDFWSNRPHDAVALLFTYVTVSDRLAKVQAIEQSFGLPFSNGATGIQSNEMLLEANYQFRPVPGINFQPEFQYVIRPNAQSNIRDAAVFGFRAYVNF
jgi:porin